MISQTAEYALRAIIHLASRPGEALTAHRIARITRMPAGYLSKVLQHLARARIVRSRRGLHGGFILARPVATLTLLDVVNAVDPLRRLSECPLGLDAHKGRLCALHRRLDDAVTHAEGILAGATVQDLLREAETKRPSA